MGTRDAHLVVFDFPGIKKFVFGTDRLVEIRGGSAMLDHLNRDVIPDKVMRRFRGGAARRVFSGGGAGQMIIDASPEDIDHVLMGARREVAQRSGGGLRFVWGTAPLDASKGYAAALDRAFLALERKKLGAPFSEFSPFHSGFIRECDSCSGSAAETSAYGGETRLLCSACSHKEKEGLERGVWKGFTGYLPRGDGDRWDLFRPKDFEEIGERCRARAGYTALVYADGNSMGQVVRRIKSEEQFRLFSEAVDASVREACYEALVATCPVIKGRIPADILLLGGDDLIVYLAADFALPFAVKAARLFMEKTRARLVKNGGDRLFRDLPGDGYLTISLGIAYGKSHTPISIMVDQAEELLKIAKTRGSALSRPGAIAPSCIDFHLTSRFNHVRVADCRRERQTLKSSKGEKIRLYGGPYVLEDAEALLAHARALKASGIPRSRLHSLAEAPFHGYVNGILDTLTAYGRCRRDNERIALCKALDRFGCFSLMPWNRRGAEISTVVPDLFDIVQFVNRGEEDDANDPSDQA